MSELSRGILATTSAMLECDNDTLINAAPALSKLLTKRAYHQRVPPLSLSLSVLRAPNQMTGMVTITGTKMKTKCKKRSPVQTGSTIYASIQKYIPLLIFFEFWRCLGTRLISSSCEASSIFCSPVLVSSPLSPLIATIAAGVRVAAVKRSLAPWGGGGGLWNLKTLRMKVLGGEIE